MCDDAREQRLVSWNVNGLRAVVKKDPSFADVFAALDADVFALQETKLQEGQLELDRYWFVNVYTPNAKNELARLDERLEWDGAYRGFLRGLAEQKPVVTCGDFNVAHEEIDLKNPKSNRGNAGFSDEERASFGALLDAGFTDTFRAQHPGLTGAYSWWSYRFNARKNNAGWRIDYFLVSDNVADRVVDASIHDEVFGSDHCPVELRIRL